MWEAEGFDGVCCLQQGFWEGSKKNEIQKHFWPRKFFASRALCFMKLQSPWRLKLKTSKASNLTQHKDLEIQGARIAAVTPPLRKVAISS